MPACNVGKKERVIRMSAGAAAVPPLIFGKMGTPWRVLLGIGAGWGIGTGLARFCPMSRALHINTCRVR